MATLPQAHNMQYIWVCTCVTRKPTELLLIHKLPEDIAGILETKYGETVVRMTSNRKITMK